MCERSIKDVKKTLLEALGWKNLSFEQLEAVVIDIEKNLINGPLTYRNSDGGEEQVFKFKDFDVGAKCPPHCGRRR